MVRTFKIHFISNFEVYNVVDFPGGLVVKNPAANAGDPGDVGSIPGSGRSSEGNGNPFQCAWLENRTEEPGGLQSMGSQRVGHN